MYVANKRIFYINSRNRLSGDNSAFSYKVDLDPNEKYTHCCVLNFVCPKTYYLVATGFNTFTMQENVQTATVTVPIGDYSRRIFQGILQTALNTASPNGWTYTVASPTTSQPDTGKYTYTVAGNGGVQPSFIFTTNLYEQLGFDPNTTVTFSADTLESQNVLKFQLEDALYLHSNIATNDGKDDILQEIYANSSSDFSNIQYRCLDVETYSKPIASFNNNVFTFYLSDEDDRKIDLNGLNYNFTLMLFRRNDIYDWIRKFIKFALLKEDLEDSSVNEPDSKGK